MNCKKVLIFQLRSVCYDSYTYFTSQISKGLTAAGYQVTVFNASQEPLSHLERFVDQSFDAILDCNSNLPKLQMEDGSYYLNHINAPFFDLILDHPLYHHDMLKCPIHQFHVLCLDENHRQYISRFYPHIQSVQLFSMTGSSATDVSSFLPVTQREIPVLFTGTYTSAASVMTAIRSLPVFLRKDIMSLLDLLLNDASLPLEKAVLQLAGDQKLESWLPDQIPLYLKSCFLADTYLRAYRREKLVQTIAEAGLPLWLYGDGWDSFSFPSHSKVHLHAPVDFTDTFTLMAHAKITLNLMPEFKAGTHDRIYSAMLNKSLTVTDSSKILEQQFCSGKELLFFDFSKAESCIQILTSALEHPDSIASIAAAGYTNALQNHTWNNRCQLLENYLFQQ